MVGIEARAASELARGHYQKRVNRYATYISLLSWKKGRMAGSMCLVVRGLVAAWVCVCLRWSFGSLELDSLLSYESASHGAHLKSSTWRTSLA